MERTVTRQELVAALVHILAANDVPDPRDAVEVLWSPGNGTRLFVLIANEQAKAALGKDLMRITGHRHPNAGEIWILDEAQSLALIHVAEASDFRH
jgi:hypothetical protein